MRKNRAALGVDNAGRQGLARPWKPPGTRRIARLLQSDAKGIAGADGVFIARLRRTAPKLANAADLAVRFARMLRGQSSEPVTDWLAATRSSVLKRLAAGPQREVAGIDNAIALPWSTGPAEGEISRLKTIKRQMYGRAGFELLRQRVLNSV
ncbi:transposase [Methylobacterium sp. OT2]|uniref:transposase n=1 Tax=Methylobacterium sp. OT2 TaxID=2813779 RepID=UPI00197B912C|nr:transposase [Methylobacterium sp. OT2]MBN4094675.1 transposase [Methylobacterium sp. OT2]